MFDQINHYAGGCVNLNNKERDYFNAAFEYKKVPKKTFLLREGEVCNFEAYINKGCIRNYFIDENGFELILQFAIEDWWVSDIASFQNQVPGNMFIETMEDCELLLLSPQAKAALLIKVPKLERMFRLMLQRNLAVLQNRLFKTIAAPARERYLDFLQQYPTIPQRVPQHYIASYLGISPEFLSKVRTKMAKKRSI